MTDVTIYRNPECGTTRNTLALIRNAGVEPKIIEYLKTPPSRSSTVSEGLLGRTSHGVSTKGRLIKIGCLSMASSN